MGGRRSKKGLHHRLPSETASSNEKKDARKRSKITKKKWPVVRLEDGDV